MDPSDIVPFDLHRMFLGDAPLWFLLEIVVRTAIMYIYTIALVRTMGSRTLGQLSMVEFLLVVAIGSAVGDPMFYADVPLIHGMAVIAVVVGINRLIVGMVNTSERAEQIIEGIPRRLLKDGRMCWEQIHAAKMNREELFAMLRTEKVRHLGEVEDAFLEQDGTFTLYLRNRPEITSGLRVMPPWDIETPNSWTAGDVAPRGVPLGCKRCGLISEEVDGALPACPNCGGESWVDAVTTPA